MTVLQTALTAGAAANFRPNTLAVAHHIMEDYQDLKALIEEKYSRIHVDC